MLYQPLVRTDLQHAEDIFDDIGEPLLHKMAVFEAVLIAGNETQTARTFDKTVRIASEGTYSTYFVFAPVKKVEKKIQLDDSADEEDDEWLVDFFGSFFSSEDKSEKKEGGKARLLRASN